MKRTYLDEFQSLLNVYIKMNVTTLNYTLILKLYLHDDISKATKKKWETHLIKDFNITFSVIYSKWQNQ